MSIVIRQSDTDFKPGGPLGAFDKIRLIPAPFLSHIHNSCNTRNITFTHSFILNIYPHLHIHIIL